jgi:hypothetical protein
MLRDLLVVRPGAGSQQQGRDHVGLLSGQEHERGVLLVADLESDAAVRVEDGPLGRRPGGRPARTRGPR